MMGEFNGELLKALAATAKLSADHDDLVIDGADVETNFDEVALRQIEDFKNAMFKLVMLRAYNAYVRLGQDNLPHKDRVSTADFKIVLNSDYFHKNGCHDDVEGEKQMMGRMVGALSPLTIIPNVSPSHFDLIGNSGNPDLDYLDLSDLVQRFNEGQIALACQPGL